jgi:membrane associated rhomboid family serine protease
MFVPLRDENPTRRLAFVNYGLIVANIVTFLYMWPLINQGSWWLVPGYGLVPTRVAYDPPGEAFTILTSMFMHGGWGHLGSNMLFLYIFGDNIEDALGHGRYLGFYLLSGLVAGLVQIGVDLDSTVPMVGASGAIAGVVGAYMYLFPRAPIVALNTIPLLWFVTGILPVIPAWLVAAEFFLTNVLLGLNSLGSGASGGVAVFAHLGGFVGGLLLIRPLVGRRRIARAVWTGFGGPRSSPRVSSPDAQLPPAEGPRWRRRRPRPASREDEET